MGRAQREKERGRERETERERERNREGERSHISFLTDFYGFYYTTYIVLSMA